MAKLRRSFRRPGPLTLEGVIFSALAFGIGLAATNTGANLLYLLFSLMLGFLIVSGFLSTRTLKQLKVERNVPRHLVAGEAVDLRLTLYNRKSVFSSYGLQVSDCLADDTVAGCCYFLRVAPQDKATVSYPCRFHRRGLYQFSRVQVTTTFPFGFVRRSVELPSPQEVLVYPQILPWRELGLEAPPDLGERESRRKGPGTGLYGIREQQPDEGARWIHWKKTAQLDRLMRREFEAEEKKNVCLMLDNALREPDSPESLEAFERAIVLAASVAHHLLQSEHQVELVTRSGRVPYNTGPHQRYRILRALALLEPMAAGKLAALRLTATGDVATIVFRCEGQGTAPVPARASEVYVMSSGRDLTRRQEAGRTPPRGRGGATARQPEAVGR